VPYALGLSLPFRGITDTNVGGAFEIVNNNFGWAGVFRNNNPANTDAALNVTSMGALAGAFLNDGGGTTLEANNTGSGTGVYASINGSAADSKAIHGLVWDADAGLNSAAVRGENQALVPGTVGVWGSSGGSGHGVRGTSLSGRGVHGESTSDFGFGVYGTASGGSGIGVYGIHPDGFGMGPGVDGVTNSHEPQAAGVRGRATAQTTSGTTYGVLGQSSAIAGVGVRGESDTGVEGAGLQRGVFGTASNIGGHGVRGEATYGVYGLGNDGGAGVVGEAGNSSTFGVWAIGDGGRLSAPALRADGGASGPAIYALGGRAIEGEGSEFGVRGVTWDPNGYGGTFTNFDPNGVALNVTGRARVDGTITVNILEIMGGADLSEGFDIHGKDVQPGLVVVIDPERPGQLKLATTAYDRKVAGIISGAGDVRPGMLMKQADSVADGEHPVALTGRVYAFADANYGPIEPGDLLTTSDTPGHVMKVTDHGRAHGATIGKAMTKLKSGRGLVLVLVGLQ
jgi:hypothetical protein